MELAPMACCFGATGSGKTYAIKRMVGLLSKYAMAKGVEISTFSKAVNATPALT